jgi:TIR domain
MTRIFISHSTRDDFTRKVRLRLAEKLREMGLEPLVDTNIEPGEIWRAKLHYWLGCCDGAVILFSRQALLESHWVKKEATILTWRKSLEPRLRIVPVLLGDVSPEELTQDYLSSLEWGEIQWARPVSREETDEAAGRLADAIARSFTGFSPRETDPGLQRWVERAAACLRKAEPLDLRRAADLLRVSEEDWNGLCEPAVVVAHHLLHTDLVDALAGLGEILAGLPRESRRILAELAEPLWIQEAAARHILPVTRRAEGQRLLAINAQYQETGNWYIHRSTCSATGTLVLRTSGVFGEDQVAEIVAVVEDACRRMVFGPDGGRGMSETLREKVLQKNLRLTHRQVFLLVDEHAVRREVVEALRQRFPSVTFVLLSGRSFPDREALGLPGIELIHPGLNEEDEEDAIATVFEVRRLAGLNEPTLERR